MFLYDFYNYVVILKVLSTRFGFIGVYTDLRNLLESNKESDGFKVNPVSKLLSNIQNCIAQMIGEETNKIKARYFHLFIDKNKDSALNSELIGQQIIKTYLNNDNAASETIIHI